MMCWSSSTDTCTFQPPTRHFLLHLIRRARSVNHRLDLKACLKEDLCLRKDATAPFIPRGKHTWYRFKIEPIRHRFLNWRCALIEVGLFSTLLIGTGKTPIRPEIVSRRGQVKTRTLADLSGVICEDLPSELGMNEQGLLSWQSARPTSVCRNFIERALQSAIDRLRADVEIERAQEAFTEEAASRPGARQRNSFNNATSRLSWVG